MIKLRNKLFGSKNLFTFPYSYISIYMYELCHYGLAIQHKAILLPKYTSPTITNIWQHLRNRNELPNSSRVNSFHGRPTIYESSIASTRARQVKNEFTDTFSCHKGHVFMPVVTIIKQSLTFLLFWCLLILQTASPWVAYLNYVVFMKHQLEYVEDCCWSSIFLDKMLEAQHPVFEFSSPVVGFYNFSEFLFWKLGKNKLNQI